MCFFNLFTMRHLAPNVDRVVSMPEGLSLNLG